MQQENEINHLKEEIKRLADKCRALKGELESSEKEKEDVEGRIVELGGELTKEKYEREKLSAEL